MIIFFEYFCAAYFLWKWIPSGRCGGDGCGRMIIIDCRLSSAVLLTQDKNHNHHHHQTFSFRSPQFIVYHLCVLVYQEKAHIIRLVPCQRTTTQTTMNPELFGSSAIQRPDGVSLMENVRPRHTQYIHSNLA